MVLPPSSDLTSLDARAREIFREIVESYLTTGEPVGLAHAFESWRGVGLSAASIRNTMADLAGLGLLEAPHAMAGTAARHSKVCASSSIACCSSVMCRQRRSARSTPASQRPAPTRKTSWALPPIFCSRASRAALGLVVTPERDAPVRHAEIVGIGPGQALLVLVFEDNQVENRIINVPADLPCRAR